MSLICMNVPHKQRSNSDPYWANVTSLLHFDGDVSDLASPGRVWVPQGTITYQVGQAGQAAKFNNPGVNRFATPSASAFDFSTGDFTIECFVYMQAAGGGSQNCGIYYQGETNTNQQIFSLEIGSGSLRFLNRGVSGTIIDLNGAVPTLNSWLHFALCREGNNFSLYQTGGRSAFTTLAAGTQLYFPSAYDVKIGARASSGGTTFQSFPGLMDEFRITKGVARYSGLTYTVPSYPFASA